jgi:1,2-diacylglycerol 3-alpha-glucosyltransferase
MAWTCPRSPTGSGPDLDLYKKLAKKYKLEDSVIFTGAVPWEEVPYYYAISDVFATASVSETQGLTVIEAMSSGLPVVAAHDKAFDGVVIDDLNGKFFKNKREYKKIMMQLLGDKDKIAMMSEQAKITADSHSLKYYADKIVYVYKRALHGLEKESIFKKISKLFKR